MTVPDPVRDQELVADLRQGGRPATAALRTLFCKYAPVALVQARRITKEYHLAEEVVQEAFLALWTSPGSYDAAKGSLGGYLLAAVHHLAVDAVRREDAQLRRRLRHSAGVVDQVPDVADDFLVGLERLRHQSALAEAMTRLPGEQRQVVDLMYYDGLSQQAIAHKLHLPLGTVKSRTALAMRKLRRDVQNAR